MFDIRFFSAILATKLGFYFVAQILKNYRIKISYLNVYSLRKFNPIFFAKARRAFFFQNIDEFLRRLFDYNLSPCFILDYHTVLIQAKDSNSEPNERTPLLPKGNHTTDKADSKVTGSSKKSYLEVPKTEDDKPSKIQEDLSTSSSDSGVIYKLKKKISGLLSKPSDTKNENAVTESNNRPCTPKISPASADSLGMNISDSPVARDKNKEAEFEKMRSEQKANLEKKSGSDEDSWSSTLLKYFDD